MGDGTMMDYLNGYEQKAIIKTINETKAISIIYIVYTKLTTKIWRFTEIKIVNDISMATIRF